MRSKRKSGSGREPSKSPTQEHRLVLLRGPYTPPKTRIGKMIVCVLRGKAKVCAWSDGRIPWPIIRVGHGGKGAYAMTPELARAVRHESAAAVMHWWGVSIVTVTHWRQALGVEQFNEGTRKLWSLWKELKLPHESVRLSKGALRATRVTKGMTLAQVAKGMGWNSINTYAQLENGRRYRATRRTLQRLAKVLGCQVDELIADGQ